MTVAERIYLDHNAGAPLLDAARDAMIDALAHPGNASSVHGEGRESRRRIETARRAVADLVGASPRAVTFTSGGTEAAVTVLTPQWFLNGRPLHLDRLLVSAIEHPCVLKGGRFPADRIEILPVDADGLVDLEALDRRLADLAAAGERPLVSVMLANNETGVIQPIAQIARRVHAVSGLLHSDAVQAAGRMAIDLATLGADVITLSAHKIGGPQRGCGRAGERHAVLHPARHRRRAGGAWPLGDGECRGDRRLRRCSPGGAGLHGRLAPRRASA
ncbi:Cysteine desulfurase [Methylobrevis pamukkalensis]|uniref:Cysteine desulfurase n=1 Tax=Methylobrevis pamukkalensis TaxID=1439726 RepID=A0A1E3H4J9_9HYPH|nr:Cysteine desulfurase [Methylobrevis pamukkalensis]